MNRKLFRNKLTGFIFGKYDLEKLAANRLINKEEYISGIEIIYYDEIMIIISVILSLLSIIMVFYSPYFLLTLLITPFVVFLSLYLEIVILTDERVIIERRGIIEKILSTNNELSLSLDQIAVIDYHRAPFQKSSLLISAMGIFTYIIVITLFDLLLPVIVVLSVFLLGFLYLGWFGLRLGKRSIDLSVIGVPNPIGIGRIKGIPLWFIRDLQSMVFERIHHMYHQGEVSQIKSELKEYPLQYSNQSKEIINKLHDPLQQHIIKLLDESGLGKKQLRDHCKKYSSIEIDEAVRQLRVKNYIYYDRSMKQWKLLLEDHK